MVEKFSIFLKNKKENAVFRQANGLTADEICNGLNTGKSPLQMYAEKRGYFFGEVFLVKDLGYWAFQKCIPLIHLIYSECDTKNYLRFDVIREYLDGYDFSEVDETYVLNEYWQIAMTCLGKVEIENKLKELK